MRDKPWSQWLRRAESNLARARFGRQVPEVLYEDLCFDAQQAAEKSLKALMLYMGMENRPIHASESPESSVHCGACCRDR